MADLTLHGCVIDLYIYRESLVADYGTTNIMFIMARLDTLPKPSVKLFRIHTPMYSIIIYLFMFFV
jgi:hypothetical protein